MIKKINRKAHFWIRVLASLIDLTLFIIFAIGTSFLVFNYKNVDFYTTNILNRELIYRMWLFSLILVLFLLYILIPVIFKGQTIGMLTCKIKIISTKSKRKLWKTVFDRQRLFSFLWMFVLLAFMLVSTDAFLKATKGNKLNMVEKIVFSLPTTLATIAINLEIIMILSGVGASRLNWNDKFSQSQTVWINKYDEIDMEEELDKKISPIKREMPKINFFTK
ncbi:RDD family protein [Mycoplasma enhydrae]|uniref:RDD family protein n=1 Tax=Mycoplasma enhydrae TaxID=2499220 RepID=UPI0021E74A69|nr:RDD family protein [Mycoplasma enhydrae]MCV3753537.1 RDD family protein [Mycoplasma enhydrae]